MMKMRIVTTEEAKSLRFHKGPQSQYGEVYEAFDKLERGKVLVVELDDDRAAKKLAGALSTHVISDNKKKSGRFYGCYYSKSGCIVLIGKN